MKEVNKSFWDFFTVAGSTVLAVPIMLISESIQARYLGPVNYGKIALFIGAISLLNLSGLNWLQRTIMRYGKEEFLKENHLRKTSGNFIIINLFIFSFVAILFYLFKTNLFEFLEIKNTYAYWIILLGLSLVVTKDFVFEVLKVIRMIKVQQILFRLATKLFVSSGILALAFIIMSVQVEYIIAAFFISDFLVILIGFYFIKKSYLFPLQFSELMARKMLLFALPLLFTNWSSYLINWIDIYVIKYFMTMTDVGIYQAAYKMLSSIKSFWGAGIVTISTPIIMVYKTQNENDKIIYFYLKRLMPQISFISMVIISFILLFSDNLISFIYGASFAGSSLPFKILVASVNFSVIAHILMAIITSFDMTRYMLYVGIIVGTLNLIADIIMVQYFGLIGAAIASSSIFTISPLIWFFIIEKRLKFNRPLVLLFPIATYIILIINIGNHFLFRLVFTCILILLTYFIGRHFGLFIIEDKKLISNIKMPLFLRKLFSRTIQLLSKN